MVSLVHGDRARRTDGVRRCPRLRAHPLDQLVPAGLVRRGDVRTRRAIVRQPRLGRRYAAQLPRALGRGRTRSGQPVVGGEGQGDADALATRDVCSGCRRRREPAVCDHGRARQVHRPLRLRHAHGCRPFRTTREPEGGLPPPYPALHRQPRRPHRHDRPEPHHDQVQAIARRHRRHRHDRRHRRRRARADVRAQARPGRRVPAPGDRRRGHRGRSSFR